MSTYFEKQLEKFASEIEKNNHNDYAGEFLKIVNSDSHKKLFKTASHQCCCPENCDCSNDICHCKKANESCNMQCKSCGKDMEKEAFLNLFNNMIKMSESLDSMNRFKEAEAVLKIAQKTFSKFAGCDEDMNDVRMKSLNRPIKGPMPNLSRELEELELDPDYIQFAKNPEYEKAKLLEETLPTAIDDWDTNWEAHSDKRVPNLTDEDFKFDFSNAEDPLLDELENEKDFNSGSIDVLFDEPVLSPPTARSWTESSRMDDELFSLPTERNPSANNFLEQIEFPEVPDIKDEDIPAISPGRVFASAIQKLNQYFSKQAEEIESEETEDFEDEE